MEIFEAVHALSSLAHETRLGVFRLLVQAGPQGMAVGRIADTLGVAAPTLSFHLKELTHAGLVLSRQEGRFIYYRANYDAMNALLAYLTDNCCQGEACLSGGVCEPNSHGDVHIAPALTVSPAPILASNPLTRPSGPSSPPPRGRGKGEGVSEHRARGSLESRRGVHVKGKRS